MTRKDDKGDQPRGGEMTWTNTGATRYGGGQHKTGQFGEGMLRPLPNHVTQRLPNGDDDESQFGSVQCMVSVFSFCNLLIKISQLVIESWRYAQDTLFVVGPTRYIFTNKNVTLS